MVERTDLRRVQLEAGRAVESTHHEIRRVRFISTAEEKKTQNGRVGTRRLRLRVWMSTRRARVGTEIGGDICWGRQCRRQGYGLHAGCEVWTGRSLRDG